MDAFHATTIISARTELAVAIAGDGQVSLGNTIAKANAVKIRKLDNLGADAAGVLVGFAGSAADAFALLDRFEAKLKESPANLMKAAIELAKFWRTDRALRRLESLLIVADRNVTLMISGQGDVIEPADGLCAIGSGGNFALAAARALVRHTQLPPRTSAANPCTSPPTCASSPTTPSPCSPSMTPRRKSRRRARRSHPPTIRARRALIALVALCHASILALLHILGPPPALRIDPLWVNDHKTLVQVMALLAAAALALTILSLPIRRARWITLALWIAASAAAWTLFSDRLAIVIPVVWRHAL
jgi:ATP-dependent HslUV protease subunit HslV